MSAHADLYADSNLPANHQSAVVGYALADEDPLKTGKYYIAGHLQLGDISPITLEPGQAMGVVTGGDLPPGSRAVVPQEKGGNPGQLFALAGSD